MRHLASETLGFWIIFNSFNAIVFLLDFGFNSTFTRNVAYALSGAKNIQKTGISEIEIFDGKANDELLNKILIIMKYYYKVVALVLSLILVVFGTIYISSMLSKFGGSKLHLYIAWSIQIVTCFVSLYSQYMESYLIGIGRIFEVKKILFVSQIILLASTVVFVYLELGLIGVIMAQLISILFSRLSLKLILNNEVVNIGNDDQIDLKLLKNISPNALKVGATNVGGFLVSKSSIFIGGFYLSLPEISSVGLSYQVFSLISTLSVISFNTSFPQLSALRIDSRIHELKKVYYTCSKHFVLIFITLSFIFITSSEILQLLEFSEASFLPKEFLILLFFVFFLEQNHANAAKFLLTKNIVPFYGPSIVSGFFVLVIMIIFFEFTSLGIWSVILSQGLVQLLYQNWKWPYMVYKELNV